MRESELSQRFSIGEGGEIVLSSGSSSEKSGAQTRSPRIYMEAFINLATILRSFFGPEYGVQLMDLATRVSGLGAFYPDKFIGAVIEHLLADVDLEWDRFAAKCRSSPPGFMENFDRVLSRVLAGPHLLSSLNKSVAGLYAGGDNKKKRGRE